MCGCDDGAGRLDEVRGAGGRCAGMEERSHAPPRLRASFCAHRDEKTRASDGYIAPCRRRPAMVMVAAHGERVSRGSSSSRPLHIYIYTYI